MKVLLLRVCVVRTSDKTISRRRLADYVKKLHQKACRTIFFPHSTNHIIDLWRCRCRCRCRSCRRFLNSLISVSGWPLVNPDFNIASGDKYRKKIAQCPPYSVAQVGKNNEPVIPIEIKATPWVTCGIYCFNRFPKCKIKGATWQISNWM